MLHRRKGIRIGVHQGDSPFRRQALHVALRAHRPLGEIQSYFDLGEPLVQQLQLTDAGVRRPLGSRSAQSLATVSQVKRVVDPSGGSGGASRSRSTSEGASATSRGRSSARPTSSLVAVPRSRSGSDATSSVAFDTSMPISWSLSASVQDTIAVAPPGGMRGAAPGNCSGSGDHQPVAPRLTNGLEALRRNGLPP
jgi:hypothetical protein